jgi:hypothetical protein
MDQQTVREHAQAHCEALLTGDVDRAAGDLSDALRSNLGPLLAQLPLPLTEATVESVEIGGSGYVATLRLVGESGTTRLQTRWKDREGRPTIVEASHIAEPEAAPGGPAETTEGGAGT